MSDLYREIPYQYLCLVTDAGVYHTDIAHLHIEKACQEAEPTSDLLRCLDCAWILATKQSVEYWRERFEPIFRDHMAKPNWTLLPISSLSGVQGMIDARKVPWFQRHMGSNPGDSVKT